MTARCFIPPEKLMGIIPGPFQIDPDQIKHLGQAGFGLGPADLAMSLHRLDELVTDPGDRIEGVHGALGDHGDLLPAIAPDLIRVQHGQIAAVEHNPAADDAAVFGQQAHDRLGDGRLAAARFADQPQGAAGLNFEGNVIHRPGLAQLGPVINFQVFKFQQGHDFNRLFLGDPSSPYSTLSLGLTTFS